jgi:hypothetical protein
MRVIAEITAIQFSFHSREDIPAMTPSSDQVYYEEVLSVIHEIDPTPVPDLLSSFEIELWEISFPVYQ